MQRHPQLLSHFKNYHADLIGREIVLPDEVLKTTWQPVAPPPLPKPPPLPNFKPVHAIVGPIIHPSWRRDRGRFHTPPRIASTSPSLGLQLSPRKKLAPPNVRDDSDDEGRGDITFDDLEHFDPEKVIELTEYVVRKKPPETEAKMSRPPRSDYGFFGKEPPEPPQSILWPVWSLKLDDLLKKGKSFTASQANGHLA